MLDLPGDRIVDTHASVPGRRQQLAVGGEGYRLGVVRLEVVYFLAGVGVEDTDVTPRPTAAHGDPLSIGRQGSRGRVRFHAKTIGAEPGYRTSRQGIAVLVGGDRRLALCETGCGKEQRCAK